MLVSLLHADCTQDLRQRCNAKLQCHNASLKVASLSRQ